MKFEERPDYSYARKIFRDLFVKSGMEQDYDYDWIIRRNEKRKLLEQQTQHSTSVLAESKEI